MAVILETRYFGPAETQARPQWRETAGPGSLCRCQLLADDPRAFDWPWVVEATLPALQGQSPRSAAAPAVFLDRFGQELSALAWEASTSSRGGLDHDARHLWQWVERHPWVLLVEISPKRASRLSHRSWAIGGPLRPGVDCSIGAHPPVKLTGVVFDDRRVRVFRGAWRDHPDDEVAVKALQRTARPGQAPADAIALAHQSGEHEFQILKRAAGQGVVRVHGGLPLSENDDVGDYALLLDLHDGPNLTDLILRFHPVYGETPASLSCAQYLAMAQHIAQHLIVAVRRLHDDRVIHRDLKPANVVFARSVNAGRTPTLIDFGIAHADGVASPHWLVTRTGTPFFASPAQRAGAAPSPTDDVHALTVTLVTAFTGLEPRTMGSSVPPQSWFESPSPALGHRSPAEVFVHRQGLGDRAGLEFRSGFREFVEGARCLVAEAERGRASLDSVERWLDSAPFLTHAGGDRGASCLSTICEAWRPILLDPQVGAPNRAAATRLQGTTTG